MFYLIRYQFISRSVESPYWSFRRFLIRTIYRHQSRDTCLEFGSTEYSILEFRFETKTNHIYIWFISYLPPVPVRLRTLCQAHAASLCDRWQKRWELASSSSGPAWPASWWFGPWKVATRAMVRPGRNKKGALAEVFCGMYIVLVLYEFNFNLNYVLHGK